MALPPVKELSADVGEESRRSRSEWDGLGSRHTAGLSETCHVGRGVDSSEGISALKALERKIELSKTGSLRNASRPPAEVF